MMHRHLIVPPESTVESLPSAAIVDLLERGELEDWRPIAAAIARDPFSAFAERVERLIDAYPMYGTSKLWRAWIEHRRALAQGARAALMATPSLAALRRALGITQAQLASRTGMSQSDLSKLERRGDMRLSTLQTYASGLGARLRIVFELGTKRFYLSSLNARAGRPGRR
jgi:DNA-binding XRE family transcriptional regulator